MKRAKQVITGVLIAGLLATLVVAPQAVEAGGRHWGHGGPRHSHGHGHGGYGYFWGGLAAGAVTGVIVGSAGGRAAGARGRATGARGRAAGARDRPAGLREPVGAHAVERLPVGAGILGAGLPVSPRAF